MPQSTYTLMIVGDNHTGKTNLVNRITQQNFQFTSDYKMTIGFDFASTLDRTFHLWDCSAEGTTALLLPKIFTRAHAFILVFDITRPETLSKLENTWIPVVKECMLKCAADAEKPQIFLLANKSDLNVSLSEENQGRVEKILNSFKSQTKTHYLEISVKDGSNIKELITHLYSTIPEQKDEREFGFNGSDGSDFSEKYKKLAEGSLTELKKKTIANFIHNKKTISDFSNSKLRENTPERDLAEKLLRYLRDNPLTKGERAAKGNFIKILYQGGKAFFTQDDKISGPKLEIAYQALCDLLDGASANQIQKYGKMACEYTRYRNPSLEVVKNMIARSEVIGSGDLEKFFGLPRAQSRCEEPEFAKLFASEKEHFITQSCQKIINIPLTGI